MVKLNDLARAALSCDALQLRSLVQDFLKENPTLSQAPMPSAAHEEELIVAAALIELLAQRMDQAPPAWSANVGSLAEPRFLLGSVATMPRLRRMCQDESPAPLRKRNLFAPATFLQFV